MRKLGIVIVNYNGARFQNACVDSILQSDYDDFYLIVVDNGSTDESMKMLDKYDDDRIITIYNNVNLGVAAGNNIGIKKSIEIGCQYTLLLNNDTEILKNTLSVIIEKLQCHKVVSPKILYWDTKKTWYFGGEISFALGRNKDWNLDAPNTGLDHDIECDYAPTCCMAIDNDVFNKIGFMDEDYFLYYDDTDFCMRLRNAGIKILVTPDTLLYHKVSSSTGKKQSFVRVYYLNRNRLYFCKKYRREFLIGTYAMALLVRYRKIFFGTPMEKKYCRQAVTDFRNGKMGAAEFK